MLNILDLLETAHDPFQRAFLTSFASPAEGEVWQKDGVTYVELEVPGAKPDDVDVSLQDQILKVTWKRQVRGKEEKSFRTYQVSKDVDPEAVQARVENGLLTIELRRHPKAGPRKIPVLGAGSTKSLEG